MGTSWITIPEGRDEHVIAQVEDLRRRLAPSICAVLDAPETVRRDVDVWGFDSPGERQLMGAIRSASIPSAAAIRGCSRACWDEGSRRDRPRVRPDQATRRRSAQPVRSLRLLPDDLPDLRPVAGRDGLTPRATRADGRGPRARKPDDARDGRPFRCLPRLHGLRHGLPLGRPLRRVDSGHPRAGRAQPSADPAGAAIAQWDLRAVPIPAGCERWCRCCGSPRCCV